MSSPNAEKASLSANFSGGAALIPFILNSLNKPKLTKSVSLALGVGMVLKYGWDFVKSKKKDSKYTTIVFNENQRFYDYVVKWIALTKPEYDGAEFEFVDLGNIKNNSQNEEIERKICEEKGVKYKSEQKSKSFDFIPSGRSKLFINNIEIWVEHEKFSPNKENKYGRDKIRLQIASKKEEELEKVLEKIEEIGRDKTVEPKTVVYTYGWDWRVAKKIFKVKDVVLPNNEFENLKNYIGNFLKSRDFYEKTNTPYRASVFMKGVSGAGKSTTVEAIATHFNLNVYVVNLSEMTDDTFMRAILEIPEKGILLLEDVDCVVAGERKMGETGVSFSGLLNALDGICTSDARITFQTSNHPEKLDPAQIRSGRADYHIEFFNATKEQIKDLGIRFGYSVEESERLSQDWSKENIPMCEVQNRFKQKLFSINCK